MERDGLYQMNRAISHVLRWMGSIFLPVVVPRISLTGPLGTGIIFALSLLVVGVAELMTWWVDPRLGLVVQIVLVVALFQAVALMPRFALQRPCFAMALMALNHIMVAAIALSDRITLGSYVVVTLLFLVVETVILFHLAHRRDSDLADLVENPSSLLESVLLAAVLGLFFRLAVLYMFRISQGMVVPHSIAAATPVILMALLAIRELAAVPQGHWPRFGRLLHIAIIQYLLIFAIIIVTRLATVLG